MTVSDSEQILLLSQTGLTFTAVSNDGTVPSQSIGVLNTGAGMLNWSVDTSTLSGGNWLTVSPTSGTTDAGTLEAPSVEVSVSAAGLEPGEYYG